MKVMVARTQLNLRRLAPALTALAACVLGLFTPQDARAQKTGIRAQPPTYVTYNNVASRYDLRAEEISLNVNNPPASTYNPIAVPPPAQYSFLQTSDGENLLSTVLDRTGRLVNTLPNPPAPPGALAPNPTFGGLVGGRAWHSADVTMAQCFSGGFAWNIQGSLRPSAGVEVRRTIPYTFAAAANFNELAYAAQDPFVNAPQRANEPNATTAIGGFTQGHAWSDWNTAAAPGNNSLGRYQSYQTSVLRDPFTAGNTTTDWGNLNFFSLPNKAFESPVYASSDALKGGAVNLDAGTNNVHTMEQAAANPTFAVLIAFSAVNDNRFILDLEREYVALRSNGIAANRIAVLYGDGSVAQLRSFNNIAAANRRPNFDNIYTDGFTMPVSGSASLTNIRNLLDGSGWAGLGLAAPPAGAKLFLYTTGHGGAVNVGAVPTATNQVGNGVITSLTLSGPPNPTGKTNLQIASNSPAPASIFFNDVLVDGNLLPDKLAVDVAPFDVSSFLPTNAGPSLYYYSVSVPGPYFTADGNGTYTLDLQQNGSSNTADLDAFVRSVVAVTLSSNMGADFQPDAKLTGMVDTYTHVVIPEPSVFILIVVASAGLLAVSPRRLRRQYCAQARAIAL